MPGTGPAEHPMTGCPPPAPHSGSIYSMIGTEAVPLCRSPALISCRELGWPFKWSPLPGNQQDLTESHLKRWSTSKTARLCVILGSAFVPYPGALGSTSGDRAEDAGPQYGPPAGPQCFPMLPHWVIHSCPISPLLFPFDLGGKWLDLVCWDPLKSAPPPPHLGLGWQYL